MRAVAWVVVGLVVALPHETDAGKSKKRRRAEAFTLVTHDAHTTKAGVELALEERGHGQRADGRELATWVLVASSGDERVEAYFTNEEPWAELVAFDTVYQATPADGGVHVKVIPGAATELADDAIERKVTDEADKARIAYSGIGRATMAGVSRVVLGGDDFWVVEARVGQFTGAVLDYRVDPYAKVELTLPKGGVVGRLAADGAEVEVGGLNVSVVEGGLSVRKGKKVKAAPAGLAEIVMFARVLWVRGDEVVVTPSKRARPRRKAISTSKAIDLVQEEADRRDIAYDHASATSTLSTGVVEVTLALGDETTVSAAVGAHTKKFLRYDVTRPGMGTAPKPKPKPEPKPEPKPDPVATDPSAAMATILAEHNRYRADHCAPALTWSDELAATAQAWAETLQNARCAFEHSKSKYGENLAAGSTGWLSPEEVVGMWYREVDEYNFLNGGFSMSTGHFTQLVWKKTKRVGCGMVTDCEGMDIWVCNYDPPGNYTDQYDENVLATSCHQ